MKLIRISIMHEIEPIGTIQTPFNSIENMPIQPKGALDVEGQVRVDKKYMDGLQDIEGFSHIYLVYSFHKALRTELSITPFMDTEKRGVFATRSPLRPNHIGMSIVKLKNVQGNCLIVEGVDVLNGTPLLDIKPYIKEFDAVKQSASGWFQSSEDDVRKKRSDQRFK